jgi:hypothetical protein
MSQGLAAEGANDGLGTLTSHRAGSSKAPYQMKVRPVKGKSRFRGVSWNKSAKKWQVNVIFRDERYYFGSFDNEEEAARVWDREALRIK